jgi:uncharacterized membrane protein YbhN (UPF0104 family)
VNLVVGFAKRHAIKLVASALITVGIIFTAHQGGLKLVPDGGDFDHVRWWALGAYVALLLGMTWFRSIRWRFLLHQIADMPKKKLFAISCAGFAAILLMPFRLGELARPYLVRTKPSERASSDKVITMTAATSSIVAERVIDGLFLSIILAIVLVTVPTVHPLPDHVVGLPITVAQVRWSGYAMLVLFTIAFVTIAVFYFARAWAHKATLAVFGVVSTKLAEKLAGIAEKLADGLHVFGRWRDLLGFLGETALYWAFNATGMWVLAWGCGVVHADGSPITIWESAGLMGFLGCAILIPGPPGLLGVFQAGIYAGMTMYFPTDVVISAGAAYVFLLYVSQFLFTIVTGAWGLWDQGGYKLASADSSVADEPGS